MKKIKTLLFDELSLRKGLKSSFTNIFESVASREDADIPEYVEYVLDGGHLLLYVTWPKTANFGNIFDMYSEHIWHRYVDNVMVNGHI